MLQRKETEREKQEAILKKHFHEFYEIYKYSLKFMKKRLYSYPNIYSTMSIVGNKEILDHFWIDFSLGFGLSCKRGAFGNFYFTASCSTIDPDFDYPSKIPLNELSFWLPRLIIQNFEYEEKHGYR